MADPKKPDMYIDEILHNPGESPPAPKTETDPDAEAPEWPEGQVPPEEQSDG